ncbi:16390_t:CDS:2 [Rhizophagus irregularis]|nr:16390_t:CDS:2 [Rhizophagus irregularis]
MPRGSKKQNPLNMFPTSPPMINLDDDPPDYLPELSKFSKITSDDSAYKSWICLYPIYFDSTKSVQKGRRVSKDIASPHPLAKDIAEVVKNIGINCLYEPHKGHPCDWENPGRVRVQLFNEDKTPFKSEIPTQLIKRVASSLPEIQKINPQQFPPSHSPAASSGMLKEGKGGGDVGSSNTSATTSGQSISSASGSSKKKGRKGRK